MVCLDSDIIIDFLRNDSKTVSKLKDFQDEGVGLSTTTINCFELFKGAMRSKQKDARERLSVLLNKLQILDFNILASEKAAEISEDLRLKGTPLDPMDLLIASIVLANKEKLFTRNVKHFERIKELILYN